MQRGTLLVVDDDRLIRWSLRQHFEQAGYLIREAVCGEEALKLFQEGVDLVLLDHRLPDAEGLDLLVKMNDLDPDIPVIMLTAYSSVDQAVQAMKRGAFHYAGKPFDLEELALIIERALETLRLRRRVGAMHACDESGFDCIIGDSPPMRQAKALLAKIAGSPSSTVLLTGESGTGKDLAAKAIHQNSDRSSGPFMNITCSALSAPLLESELFGHERGAFTDAKSRKKGLLEHAHTGTVFLNEIGEMEPAVQGKLLRFLEEKTFRRVGGTVDLRTDVRIIAATNADLKQAVLSRTFREDLYYRLAVLTVWLPPVRDRGRDVEIIVAHFIAQFNREFGKQVGGVSRSAMKRLRDYHWPGNVRELRNAVERAVLLTNHTSLDEDDFQMIPLPGKASPGVLDLRLPAEGLDFRALERSLVQQALKRARGNKTQAATLLGMNRDQIRYRIDKFGL